MAETMAQRDAEDQETDDFEDAYEETSKQNATETSHSPDPVEATHQLGGSSGFKISNDVETIESSESVVNGTHAGGGIEQQRYQPQSAGPVNEAGLSTGNEMKPEQEDAHELTMPEIASASVIEPMTPEPPYRAAQVLSPTPSEPDNPLEVSQSQPPKKKLFGWLSRNSNAQEKTLKPPPLPARRDTSSSVNTITSVDEHESFGPPIGLHRSHRNSLQNRFKLVRLREEAGVDLEGTEDGRPAITGRSPSFTINAMLSGTDNDAKAGKIPRGSSSPISPVTEPILNESLAPGTAAGASAGPSDDLQGPVDWDLWQEVVYEGPAAVARTSADELSQAIARGIPSAIRGVVWQVLAQSKNDELEIMYKDLVARGNAMERRMSDLKSRPLDFMKRDTDALNRRESAPASIVGNKSHETIHSATSSIHSEPSSPPNETAKPPFASQEATNLEMLGRYQTDSVLDEKRRVNDQQAIQKLEKAIRRDLGARTSYSKFLMSGNLQEGLFGICKAYALFDEDVGYAQGMNFIAMPLLFNMPEEEAFCLFVRLMNQYHLRNLFVQDMSGLHLHLYQFERLLEDLEPALYCHLHRRGVTPQLYATQWFLTLFAYRFPLQLVLRIYDLILSEGLESAILKFGMVLMQKNSESLLQMKDMADLTTFLKERIFDVYIDKSPSATSVLESGFFGSAGGIDKEIYRADALVQDACAIKITPEMLKAYTTEWEEKTRDEKEKAAAEEALRASIPTLTQRLRALEERVEKSDTEHVQMASELVRTKVANQQLADENESLKIQVAELQTIIQTQPGEVEGRLRQEMDRIMKRNIEVQNENRALEESCTEMEGELIKAKLLHAEVNGELDSMRQKWSSISAMMNSK